MGDRSNGRPIFEEKPSKLRMLSLIFSHLMAFLARFFDILTPKWLPTLLDLHPGR